MKRAYGYGFAEETTSTGPYKRSNQETEERREASIYRRKAEELDRTTKSCMDLALDPRTGQSDVENYDHMVQIVRSD